MYRRFHFEGAIHETLECVPLAVRRKLDLAALKISLDGWQSLPITERRALCEMPIDTAEELTEYRRALHAFADAARLTLRTLPEAHPEEWRASDVPLAVETQLTAAGRSLGRDDWGRLGEEERYALLKLAAGSHDPIKLLTLLAELGLGPPTDAPPDDGRCERAPNA